MYYIVIKICTVQVVILGHQIFIRVVVLWLLLGHHHRDQTARMEWTTLLSNRSRMHMASNRRSNSVGVHQQSLIISMTDALLSGFYKQYTRDVYPFVRRIVHRRYGVERIGKIVICWFCHEKKIFWSQFAEQSFKSYFWGNVLLKYSDYRHRFNFYDIFYNQKAVLSTVQYYGWSIHYFANYHSDWHSTQNRLHH